MAGRALSGSAELGRPPQGSANGVWPWSSRPHRDSSAPQLGREAERP